ncbi:MAG: ScyD/ScyE family protein [Dehalococcoidia bacterium]|nr:ScyD/ScyE family protein [Dehalococcoidia bacterium]HRC61712.1 ScyD/ScyE family protein [Dehalococcoidia bacterium]
MKRWIALVLSSGLFVALAVMLTAGAGAADPPAAPTPTAGTKIATGFGMVLGTTVGPDNALYVADASTGSVWRVDPESGKKTLFAEGLPTSEEGGVSDIAFIGFDLYALTTSVDSPGVVGIYHLPKHGKWEILADLGAYSKAHPVGFADAAPTGNPFRLDVLDAGRLLVVDSNHNRLLVVETDDGDISQLAQFQNIVPTGTALADNVLYLSQIGAFPHKPEDGRVWAVTLPEGEASLVAAGTPFIIDVEKGPSSRLYALSFGTQPNNPEGPPADPFSGKLLLVGDGSFQILVANLTMPTSLEVIGDTAYVTTLGGDVWRIDNVSSLN